MKIYTYNAVCGEFKNTTALLSQKDVSQKPE